MVRGQGKVGGAMGKAGRAVGVGTKQALSQGMLCAQRWASGNKTRNRVMVVGCGGRPVVVNARAGVAQQHSVAARARGGRRRPCVMGCGGKNRNGQA